MAAQRISINYTVVPGDENTLAKAIAEGGDTVTDGSYTQLTLPTIIYA